MNLSAADLFYMFCAACSSVGINPGYSSSRLSQTTPKTQQVWLEFSVMLSKHLAGTSILPPVAITTTPTKPRSLEDLIVNLCEQFDQKEQHKLYEYLYTLGHRIR